MWSRADFWRESRRNIDARHLVVGAVIVVILAAVATMSIVQAQRSLGQEAQLREAGSLVWIAYADDDATLDGRTCSGLQSSTGVTASGGLAAGVPPRLFAYDGGRVLGVTVVTGSAVRVFAPGVPAATSYVGGNLAASDAVSAGQTLVAEDRVVLSSGPSLPDGVPIAALNSHVVLTGPDTLPLRQCWVRLEPGAVDAGRDLLAYAYPGAPMRIERFAPPAEGLLTPAQQWMGLASAHLELAAGLLIGLLWSLFVWTRRAETAVYRTFGTRTADVVALIALEFLRIVPPALVTAVLIAQTASSALSAPPDGTLLFLAWRIGTAAVLLALPVAALGTWLTVRGSLITYLKDRA